jgi:hypothetical protein
LQQCSEPPDDQYVNPDDAGAERPVDEGAVDDEVYIIEAVLEDRDTNGYGYAYEAAHEER